MTNAKHFTKQDAIDYAKGMNTISSAFDAAVAPTTTVGEYAVFFTAEDGSITIVQDNQTIMLHE